MKKYLLIFSTLFLLFASCSDSVSPTPQFGKIQIKVIDPLTNLPVNEAFIKTNPPTHSVFLNSDGQYLLEDVLPGDYEIIINKINYLENSVVIKVNAGKIAKAEIYLFDESFDNVKPDKPILESPSNGASIRNLSTILKWSCSDPDNDELRYVVYFDKVNPPKNIIASDIAENDFEVTGLVPDTKYYWSVVAKDKYTNGPKSSVFDVYIDTNLTINDDSMILSLPFNGEAKNFSKYSFQTSTNNPAYTYDRSSNANRAFDFNKNYVYVENATILNFENSFTVSLWIKPNSVYGQDMIDGIAQLVGRIGATGVNTSSWSVGLTGNLQIIFETYQNSTGTSKIITDQGISSTTWSHIAITYYNQNATIYINGNEVKKATINKPQSSSYNLFIGCRQLMNRYYIGAMDDLKIFNKVLDANEINYLSK